MIPFEMRGFITKSTADLKSVLPTVGQINEYITRIAKVRKNSRSRESRKKLNIIIADLTILKERL